MSDVVLRIRQELTSAPNGWSALEPAREATARGLSIDVWSGPGDEVDARLLRRLKEGLKREDVFGREVARLSLKLRLCMAPLASEAGKAGEKRLPSGCRMRPR